MVWFADIEKKVYSFDEKKEYSYIEREVIGLGNTYILNAENRLFFLTKEVYDELRIRYPQLKW